MTLRRSPVIVYRHVLVAPHRPRPRVADDVVVRRDPGARVAQWCRLELGDRAVGGGADVEQQVAALGHDLGQERHDLAAGHVVLGAFGTVVAEAVGDASTQLPRSVDDAVGRLVLEHLDVRTVEPPSIVDDDLRVAVAGGVDQPLAAPVLRAVSPVAVTPQVLRPEAFDEIEHMGMQHLVDVLVSSGSAGRPSRAGSSTCRTRARIVRRPPRTRRARCGPARRAARCDRCPGASHQHNPSWCLATRTV